MSSCRRIVFGMVLGAVAFAGHAEDFGLVAADADWSLAASFTNGAGQAASALPGSADDVYIPEGFLVEIDSTSAGFTSRMLPSTPSISMSGPVDEAIEVTPRMLMEGESPARPEDVMFTFGIAPLSISPTLAALREVSWSPSTTDTAPVRFTFFCVP